MNPCCRRGPGSIGGEPAGWTPSGAADRRWAVIGGWDSPRGSVDSGLAMAGHREVRGARGSGRGTLVEQRLQDLAGAYRGVRQQRRGQAVEVLARALDVDAAGDGGRGLDAVVAAQAQLALGV